MIDTLSLFQAILLAHGRLFEIYLFVFGAAAVACFGSIGRALRISNDDTRNGLVALLVTSGLWAAFHVGYLAAPTPRLQYGFYTAGLVVGLSTVGPWLYFCSAYTGRTLHRNPTYQRLAVGVYLAIVAVKVTNPFHGLYFSAQVVETPFPHLLIEHGALHWTAMGLAYALAVIGIFMLFELFAQVDYDTRPFAILVGLTALPVVFDIVGFVTPLLLDVSYSAIGVAVFAVGVLFSYIEQFETIQLAGQYDDPVIVVDDEDEIRDYNRAAVALFPQLEEAIDAELPSVVPRVAVSLTSDEPLECTLDGETRYYSVSTNQFSTGKAQLGRLILLKDVTEQERYRRELETQNARLEQFTGMVSHDLRNPLNIAQGNIDLARETGDDEPLETVKTALDRMEELIEDLLALARQGKPIDDTERVSLAAVVRSCWEMVDVADAELVVDGDTELDADRERLQQLFENLVRNAVEHGGEDVTISVGPLDDGGFYVEDDGPGIPEAKHDEIFESGYTTSRQGTGFGLSIVTEIVDAHGWSISVTNGETGGARFEIETGSRSRDVTENEPDEETATEVGADVDRV
ncbi:ATP-binding protein [Halohasta salina]|uniref:sensor histidine kinase n=1 Tax=Halohasta salina TaxID=2961621 RepID=UPI0020A5C277|nr:ATP-binding protein [Halohasta salina]